MMAVSSTLAIRPFLKVGEGNFKYWHGTDSPRFGQASPLSNTTTAISGNRHSLLATRLGIRMAIPLIEGDPDDDRLRREVHPADWRNPTPGGIYNLVAIGAGAAGLVSAIATGGLGGRAAIIERDLLGGDCLNVGCVPSKALIRAGRVAAEVRRAAAFGIRLPGEPVVDFPAVMQRVRRVRADISPNDSARRLRDQFNVDVFFGNARFTGPNSLEVEGTSLEFRRAVIATGARAIIPTIPGLEALPTYTHETVFQLRELPRRLLVLGGGPIGCELGQAFARLGASVTLVSSGEQLLPRDDPDAAALLERALRAEGVTVYLRSHLQRVEPGTPARAVLDGAAAGQTLAIDAVLVAVGRQANYEDLNLAAAQVVTNERGIIVDDYLQTTNPAIYAAGDVVGRQQFTHAADAMARLAVRNALFLGRGRLSRLVIPWCTFTEPEVARVGLSRAEATAVAADLETIVIPWDHLDRAITDDTPGFLRLLVSKGTDQIAGATVVGPQAGEIIGLFSTVMTQQIGLKRLARTVFPYPTLSESIKKAADRYNRSRVTPIVQRFFRNWLYVRRHLF
jgi:pyruvate/2-oxoglutarate dehydrogenase complex dihydrolipoamide dehydrogenase (E3) component